MSTAKRPMLTIQDYLQIEKETGERHQFFRGEVFLMAGGTPKHAAIAANIIRALGNAIDDGPCQVFTSDIKIRVKSDGLCTYPDAAVVCDDPVIDDEVPNAVTNPTIIVEVLSDSTADYDRGGKAHSYRQIESLQQYIIVHQDERYVEWYVREDDHWKLMQTADGDVPVLAGGSSISLEAIYQKIEIS